MEPQETGAGRPAAFFDLDGTLIRGSANIPLALAAFKHGRVTPLELAKDLRNNISFLFKGATDELSDQVRDRILAAVAGHPVAEVVALADEFMDSLVEQVRPEIWAVLEEHAAAGHDRIIISASPTEIVSRLAAELGLEYGIGTTSEHVSGVYTGRLLGPFCYREGKAEVLRAVAQERGYDLGRSFAYSDSISDLPMLRSVGISVAVNPDAELRLLAQAEEWDIIETSGARSGLGVPSPQTVVSAAVTVPSRTLRVSRWLLEAGVGQARAMGGSILSG
jgi:HAD superfamily hydrolase (TIGR01490 family)